MSQTRSSSFARCYGLARVARVWKISRASVYRSLKEPPDTIARRCGLIGASSDAELADHIRRHEAACARALDARSIGGWRRGGRCRSAGDLPRGALPRGGGRQARDRLRPAARRRLPAALPGAQAHHPAAARSGPYGQPVVRCAVRDGPVGPAQGLGERHPGSGLQPRQTHSLPLLHRGEEMAVRLDP